MENLPSVEELMAFYRANKVYVDLIVQNAIANNPQMKQMREQMEFEKQLKEFSEEFPDSGMRSPEDFLNAENAKQFLSYIGKGLSLVQAYKLSNFQTLMENAGKRGKKAGMEQVQSKSHMKATAGSMAGTSGSIPEDVKELYHALLGDWSDSQIAKHYNRK